MCFIQSALGIWLLQIAANFTFMPGHKSYIQWPQTTLCLTSSANCFVKLSFSSNPLNEGGSSKSCLITNVSFYLLFQFREENNKETQCDYRWLSSLWCQFQKRLIAKCPVSGCEVFWLDVVISEPRMGGQRNQPFVYTPHKRRGPISAGALLTIFQLVFYN